MTPWKRISEMDVTGALDELGTSPDGLEEADAAERLEFHGPNEIEFRKPHPIFRFLKQFQSLLVYVLLTVAIFTALIGEWIDTAVITGVVVLNSIIGFIQEGKASEAIESLQKFTESYSTVIRGGKEMRIPSGLLVPGDITLLGAGERVPADIRVIESKNLLVDESALTGESVPAEKDPAPLKEEDILQGEFRNILFSGTLITEGRAMGAVISTGRETEIGRIAERVKAVDVKTPLLEKIDEFSQRIALAVVSLAAFNFIAALLFGYEVVLSFLASTSLAVAAIPEGLPAVLTVTLALAVRAMAERNAIIRNLPSVETLGSVTVICSDKTGTLTKNEMTVKSIYAGGALYRVEGAGYSEEGDITLGGSRVTDLPEPLRRILICGLRCNNASVADGKVHGDPTEAALIVAAHKGGIRERTERVDEVPFDSTRKYMAVLTEDGLIHVKGSPERIIDMCSHEITENGLKPIEKDELMDKIHEMASEGMRVLAFAEKMHSGTEIQDDDLTDMILLGFQGMIDPPRPEAVEAVGKCKSAGIRIIMITGDHAATAGAVAAELGIETSRVLTGPQLSSMDDDEIRESLEDCNVFARVTPDHKYALTGILRENGEIVAMTGDGVNDAPALKMADIGVAMGSGTDVARESADMVLADDNFATIVTAVNEGRNVYERIRRIIYYVLPTSGGQALIILLSFLLAPVSPTFSSNLPLLPLQILWINMFDGVLLALPLVAEASDESVLEKPPRDPGTGIVDSAFIRKVGLVSAAMAFSGLAVFYMGISGGLDVTGARTVTFTTVILVHVFYLLTARSLDKSVLRIPPANRWVASGVLLTVAVTLIIVYLPGLEAIFRTSAFPPEWWGIIIPFSLTGLLSIEAEKYIMGRLKDE
ncbi:HAD-IC family P-type ATPase [Methanothermobacter sp. K4]|uniref:cation-translocating P-type ATPase n=1 Tax=Methanothermobacter sp. K4 TaxID=2913262 RepID=UPI001EDA4A14|nr:HAD-IC family P-type ATPase [Methanothermobacter sp. K4]MCG2828479.1 HAD-IC family P-type ATPase [Methanothermobacter sp. K4]